MGEMGVKYRTCVLGGVVFPEVESEFALESVAAEIEDAAVEGHGEEGGEGNPYFGESEGVEQCEGGEDDDRGEDVGEENGEEAAAGVDDYGDGVAGGVAFPVGGVDFDVFVFALREGAVGVGLAGGAGAGDFHLDCYASLAGGDDGAGVCGYLHDLGAFLQFLTHLPWVFILWVWPR